MSSTTLVTFLVTIQKPARFVSLLGSWDNFRKPYPMRRDERTSKDRWRGCHTFKDIVCDGETVESGDKSRDGGLRMGGTYWYYYQINDEVDFFDDSQPTTKICPLLPGQEVNVLDVPMQACHRRPSGSSTSSTCYTLNPEDKYLTPSGSSDVKAQPSKQQHPYEEAETPTLSTRAYATASNHLPPGPSGLPEAPPLRPSPHSTRDLPPVSLRPKTRGRQAKVSGFGSDLASILRRNRQRPSSPRPQTQPCTASSLFWRSLCQPRNLWSAGDAHDLMWVDPTATPGVWPVIPRKLEVDVEDRLQLSPTNAMTDRSPLAEGPLDRDGKGSLVMATSGVLTIPSEKALELEMSPAFIPEVPSTSKSSLWLNVGEKEHSFASAFADLNLLSRLDSTKSSLQEASDNSQPQTSSISPMPADNSATSISTRRSSALLPSCLSIKTSTFSSYFSQPETPVYSDFSHGFLISGSPATEADPANSEVYNLPPDEHSSVLTFQTLRALPRATEPKSLSSAVPSPYEQKSGRQYVEEWNAGVQEDESSKSVLDEIYDELGYLGTLIE